MGKDIGAASCICLQHQGQIIYKIRIFFEFLNRTRQLPERLTATFTFPPVDVTNCTAQSIVSIPKLSKGIPKHAFMVATQQMDIVPLRQLHKIVQYTLRLWTTVYIVTEEYYLVPFIIRLYLLQQICQPLPLAMDIAYLSV